MADIFDELRERKIPEQPLEAFRDRWDRQPDGDFSLHVRKRNGRLELFWIEPPERIRVRDLDSARRSGAK
jgi:hypothetical protein